MIRLQNVLITVLVDDDTEAPIENASYHLKPDFSDEDGLIDYLVDKYDAPDQTQADWRVFREVLEDGKVMQGIFAECEEVYSENPFPTQLSSGDHNPLREQWEDGDISPEMVTRYYIELTIDGIDEPSIGQLCDALNLYAVDEDTNSSDDDDEYEYDDDDDDGWPGDVYPGDDEDDEYDDDDDDDEHDDEED